mmetsp:Transcript_5261/g.13385  ORF Transcript_5261/g.13385 Transcript_5261/m.13385 type:complete len:807 (+) Transcript_5261:137-2557(+)
MVFEDIRRADEHPETDFNDEAELMKFVRASRWISVDVGAYRLLRLNWVTTLMASIVLWGFTIAALIEPTDVLTEAKVWQSWVTQNFTWLYIGSQNAWALFLLYLCFSKYGKLKLGRSDEQPEFSDISWFAMLFSCGIGVGIYFWGVSEPMYYYRAGYSNALWKIPMNNDDDRAQQAIFTTLFHWGLHGWVVYIVVAVALSVVCYRWNMPLTMRSAFYPLLGNLIYSPLGDFIDALSIACTTFGVCTSLGFGVSSINNGLHKLNSSIEVTVDNQIIIIWVITIIATVSITMGLKSGIQTLANVTFAIGLFLLFALMFLDNTWYLLNSYVQSTGHYFQWIVQVGFQCDTFQQLQYELQNSKDKNLLWGSSGSKLFDNMKAANALTEHASAGVLTEAALYDSHAAEFMDWWTVFYWGWWISWAPFVGMFIARISRGRTIRQLILGGFFAPIVFSFLWLVVFGSLGIKMQRVAELALGTVDDVNWRHGQVNCANLGYTVGQPTSAAALALAAEGYYALACRDHGDRVFDVMEPYKAVSTLLIFLVVVGVSLYFITSSDSGSYVDDVLAAQGLPNPPLIQKIFWAFTEGAVATALLKTGGDDALAALRAVSICSGLPYTIALCVLCTSLWRALKIDQCEDDIMRAASWSTDSLDIFDLFNPGPADLSAFKTPRYSPAARIASLVKGVFAPFIAVHAASKSLHGGDGVRAKLDAALVSVWFALWIVFVGVSGGDGLGEWAYIGWAFYMFLVFHITYMRVQMRQAHGIYGNVLEDFFGCLVMYPNIVSQLEYQAEEPMPNADTSPAEPKKNNA